MVGRRPARWIWILVTIGLSADAIDVATDQVATDQKDSVGQSRQRPWRLVNIPDPVARGAAVAALNAASSRLAGEHCRQILTDFEQFTSLPLQDRLLTLSVDIETYPTLISVLDGSRHPVCAKAVLAFTTPGSRVVGVCVEELKRTWREHPEYLIAAMIHEILHTLGLGENPPSSREITKRVMARCGRPTNRSDPARPSHDAPSPSAKRD